MALLACGLSVSAFTIAAVASSSSASSNAPSKANTVSAGSNKSHGSWTRASGGHPWPSAPGAFGYGAAPFGGGGLLGGAVIGKVTSIGSDSITVTTTEGVPQTIATASSTKYYVMTTAGTGKSVAMGDRVAIVEAPATPPASSGGSGWAPMPRSNGPAKSTTAGAATAPTPTASAVIVIEPFAYGTVVSATSAKIVVTDSSGLERDILVPTASYSEAGQSIAASAITPGEQIFAWGSAASDPTQLQASNVDLIGPRVSGIVKSTSGSTITIASLGGSISVTTNGSTIFRSGAATGSLGAIKAGDVLTAIGTRGTSTFAATAVTYSAAPVATPVGGSAGFWQGRSFGGALGAGAAVSADRLAQILESLAAG